jgi:ribulose-5-phosphate 4-epimerase/fuculose-1-phosphate aldolase
MNPNYKNRVTSRGVVYPMNTPSTTDKDYYLSKPATVSEAKSQLVLANRVLANENIFDHLGHVSVRSPENERIFLISRSRSPEQVTLDDMLEVDLTGKVLTQTTERPYSERVIHAAIYTARPDVNCIIHAHPSHVRHSLFIHRAKTHAHQQRKRVVRQTASLL